VAAGSEGEVRGVQVEVMVGGGGGGGGGHGDEEEDEEGEEGGQLEKRKERWDVEEAKASLLNYFCAAELRYSLRPHAPLPE
jgi:hypothetical protein